MKQLTKIVKYLRSKTEMNQKVLRHALRDAAKAELLGINHFYNLPYDAPVIEKDITPEEALNQSFRRYRGAATDFSASGYGSYKVESVTDEEIIIQFSYFYGGKKGFYKITNKEMVS